jgi:hypothetical protein
MGNANRISDLVHRCSHAFKLLFCCAFRSSGHKALIRVRPSSVSDGDWKLHTPPFVQPMGMMRARGATTHSSDVSLSSSDRRSGLRLEIMEPHTCTQLELKVEDSNNHEHASGLMKKEGCQGTSSTKHFTSQITSLSVIVDLV